ncbi:hypothetical protein MMC19_004451 [Ptychographa xylographoides]|nr:hypothetical protein [Ptychographa xylographoides]
MAPQVLFLVLVFALLLEDTLSSTTRETGSTPLPHCFFPFWATTHSNAPLLVWLSTAIVIIPFALAPFVIYRAPNFFKLLTASRLSEDFNPVLSGGTVKLPPYVPGTAAAMKAKARLRFVIGSCSTIIVVPLFVWHGLSIAGMQLCSGDDWANGVWAIPWAEWWFVSGGFTLIALRSTYGLAKVWRSTKKTERKGKEAEPRVKSGGEEHEMQEIVIGKQVRSLILDMEAAMGDTSRHRVIKEAVPTEARWSVASRSLHRLSDSLNGEGSSSSARSERTGMESTSGIGYHSSSLSSNLDNGQSRWTPYPSEGEAARYQRAHIIHDHAGNLRIEERASHGSWDANDTCSLVSPKASMSLGKGPGHGRNGKGRAR